MGVSLGNAALNKARHGFESRAMTAYKYFGFSAKQIDRQAFQIKHPDLARGPSPEF
jgi:hypothetical protein